MRSRIHHYVIRLLIFDDPVNLERYCEVILYPLLGHLNADGIARGSTADTARVSTTLLRSVFRDRIISKDILLPQSPNLIPLDYYLWDAMKGPVYKRNPNTVLEAKEAIAYSIRDIHSMEL
jgi:hypothetical protein